MDTAGFAGTTPVESGALAVSMEAVKLYSLKRELRNLFSRMSTAEHNLESRITMHCDLCDKETPSLFVVEPFRHHETLPVAHVIVEGWVHHMCATCRFPKA